MTKDTLEDQEVVKRAGDARRARRERRTASRDGGDGKAGGAGDDAFEPGDAALPEEPDEAEPDETTPPEVHGGIAHLSRILRSPRRKKNDSLARPGRQLHLISRRHVRLPRELMPSRLMAPTWRGASTQIVAVARIV